MLGKVASALGISALLAVSAAASHASTLAPDFNRMAPLNSATLTGGDFDGDGRTDDLYLMPERETGRIAVHIRLNKITGPEDIRVTSLDAAGDRAPDLRVVPAGFYNTDCGSYSSACDSQKISAEHDSLIVGAGNGTNVLLHWSSDHFEPDFVRSDDAMLALALATIYAYNP